MVGCIAIVGKDGSGKDTLAKHLARYFSIKHDKVKVKSFNDLLYHYVCELNDIEYDKLDSEFKSHIKKRFGRDYIIKLAKILRGIDNNIFVNDVINTEADYLIVPDLRFSNELKALKSKYKNNLKIVLVNYTDLISYKKYDIQTILKSLFNNDSNLYTIKLNKDEYDQEEYIELVNKLKDE